MKKTGLDQTVSIHFGSDDEPWPNAPGFEDDPRWQLAQRVVESAQFNKSPRLSTFLLYIVAKSLEGRQNEITEQQIGVHVFGRPAGYRTVDDNIVRNYARQLRKRLTEYFAGEGIDHALRIEVPLGGYLPRLQIRENPFSSNTQCRVQFTCPLHRQRSDRAPGRACWQVHAFWSHIARRSSGLHAS